MHINAGKAPVTSDATVCCRQPRTKFTMESTQLDGLTGAEDFQTDSMQIRKNKWPEPTNPAPNTPIIYGGGGAHAWAHTHTMREREREKRERREKIERERAL